MKPDFKTQVQQHFDERAERYDQDTETCDQQDFANFEVAIPYLLLHGGNRILEVATGTGIVLERLLNAGKDAYGQDFSSGLLRIAETKRRIAPERLSNGDAEFLNFPDDHFDSVCVFRSLHHMDSPLRVLKEMIRCTNRNVFVYDSAGGWRRRTKKTLDALGLYQAIYSTLRGQPDSGYRPANETEGPVKVFYVEDVIPILKHEKLRIVKVMRVPGNLFVHAEKQTH